jgi:Peptidase family C50
MIVAAARSDGMEACCPGSRYSADLCPGHLAVGITALVPDVSTWIAMLMGLFAGSGTLSARALPHSMPTALLMGCSSAKLRPGVHGGACTGALPAYLAAGSACVVGNLWDVTDRDIDRFTADLLARCALPHALNGRCPWPLRL